MKYTGLILCTLVAALLCVASIFFLAKEITSASQRVHSVGAIRLVNFSFKTGRNFDELARALISYRDCRTTPEELPSDASNLEYVEKFDIVWSAFKVAYQNIYRHWAGTGYWLDESRAKKAQELRHSGLVFLNKYEAEMIPSGSVGCSTISRMLKDIYLQKEQISEFAQSYFELDNKAAQEQQASIGNLFTTIAVLGVSFLLMAAATIYMVYKALRLAKESLEQSVTAEQQSRTALKELSESKHENIAQKEFFAAASHDLRQPLHALGLYIGSLEQHVKTDDAKHILKCANLSADSLSALFDSLLDISRLDTGVIEPNKNQFDVADLLSRLHARFLPEVEEKGLRFVLETDECRVYSDRQLLDRMLQNMISNAIAYTQFGQVKLACRQVNGEALITVSDTGQGIPIAQQDKVFDEFYRVAGSVRDRDKGLGLGLSIVKRLGELLQVSLSLESNEGDGTTLAIRLPLASHKSAVVNNFTVRRQQPEMFENLRVLVIDDEEEVRGSTTLALESRGCVVQAVESSEAARLLCQVRSMGQAGEGGEFEPDVVVSDYRLNGDENGLTAIETVRHAVGREVPALLITGDTRIKFADDSRMVNIEVLFKPLDARALFERIASAASS